MRSSIIVSLNRHRRVQEIADFLGEVAKLNWIKEKLRKFSEGRYGIDDLGKVLIWVSIIFYVLGRLADNVIVMFLAWFAVIAFFYRALSRQTYQRNEENCKFMQYIKSWKLKYQYRKTARIYMCPQCGKLIRVPKGKKKIQITCPGCSHTIIRYT